ncbi:MAG: hypothetical protein GY793_06680 [Proteobacteria bacterium]|nr:hypothetical protein [Pseudomonadota bacterium]
MEKVLKRVITPEEFIDWVLATPEKRFCVVKEHTPPEPKLKDIPVSTNTSNELITIIQETLNHMAYLSYSKGHAEDILPPSENINKIIASNEQNLLRLKQQLAGYSAYRDGQQCNLYELVEFVAEIDGADIVLNHHDGRKPFILKTS